MSKRVASVAFNDNVDRKVVKDGKKHSLDSDEEDSGAEDEKRNVLNADDIEGEEDGAGGMEGEITITPFNMKEELEEGHFDTQGHYHWKKEKEIRDSWLDNIDWVKVKDRPDNKYKIHKPEGEMSVLDDTDSDSEEEKEMEKFDLIRNYKEIVSHMKPKETIAKTLHAETINSNSKMSSAERWKRKKAGTLDEGSQVVTRITELANQILTKTGNMDIYQETFEKINNVISKDNKAKGDSELDMYADDFDVNNAEISGPHSTEQMQKWSTDGHFKTGVWVRKYGEDTQFYSSSRIDFELYL
ncbi:putative Aspartyl beta-hydroxylase [Danaus plexippus plexippus]|uniref:Aspartyl beta-hydroxylase n=1 Tax=Danaus plexippus plexippus TaxID=278856 RepID=A0A212EHJ1_DANPL|nr:putative Aspartyl beta-hydroxylase [Danaus plexippus plexippus]